MLDINYIRANRQKVEDAIKNKGYEIDLAEILDLDDERKSLSQKIDNLRQERNQISAKMKNGKPDKALIEQGKKLKNELSELEPKLSEVEKEYVSKLKTVPNVPEDDVPIGLSEDENQVAEVVGKPRDFNFTPKNHYEIGQERDWIDKERASKVTGARFAYIKGDLVKLQMAIVNFVMNSLSDENVIKEIIKKHPAASFSLISYYDYRYADVALYYGNQSNDILSPDINLDLQLMSAWSGSWIADSMNGFQNDVHFSVLADGLSTSVSERILKKVDIDSADLYHLSFIWNASFQKNDGSRGAYKVFYEVVRVDDEVVITQRETLWGGQSTTRYHRIKSSKMIDVSETVETVNNW